MQSDLEIGYIKPADTFHSLEFDSIEVLEIVMCIEDEFAINIGDKDIESFKTVQDVINCVTKETEK